MKGSHAWLFLVLVLAGARASLADGPDLFEQGIQLRRQGRDAEALEKFRRAYSEKPSPRARAQIGLAQQALGNWVDADNDLRQALESPDDPWVSKNRDIIESGLDEISKHLGSVVVDTSGVAAELWVDGVLSSNRSGTPLRLAAGTHLLKLRVGAQAPFERSVEVPGGGTLILQTDSKPSVPSKEQSAAVPPILETRPGSFRKIAGWSLATASVLLLAEAVVAQIVRENLMASYNDDASCAPPGSPIPRSQRCGHYKSEADAAQAIAVVGFALGSVTAVGSAYFILSAPPDRTSSSSRLPVGLTVGWTTNF